MVSTSLKSIHRFDTANPNSEAEIVKVNLHNSVKARIKEFNFDFGKNTGLLIEEMGMLRRTVLVVDEKNIIRYVDFVPSGGLPDIKAALNAAKQVLLEDS